MSFRSCLRPASGVLIGLGTAMAIVVPALAATVNGTLTFAPELGQRLDNLEKERAGKLHQFYWRVPNGAIATIEHRVDPTKHLGVVLEADGSQGTAPAGQPKVVHLEGSALNPSVITITPHTKVRFRNTDAFIYELECPENAQMANAQALSPGQQVDYPFDEEGIYEITDRRLPHLVGWVVVVNSVLSKNPERGKQAGEATFSFADVAPGHYKVKVFYAGEWITEQPLEVPEEQEEVGVQISLPSGGQQDEQSDAASAESEQ